MWKWLNQSNQYHVDNMHICCYSGEKYTFLKNVTCMYISDNLKPHFIYHLDYDIDWPQNALLSKTISSNKSPRINNVYCLIIKF